METMSKYAGTKVIFVDKNPGKNNEREVIVEALEAFNHQTPPNK